MIKLFKLDEPDILKANKKIWTEEYVRLITTGQSVPDSLKYKYRDPVIKQIILQETHNKCAYCESKIKHVCPGDVEHILPKTHRPDLYVEWTNLTLSCEECNRTGKNDYYNPDEPLLNPYEDNPDENLLAIGPFITHKPGDKKGEITEKILKLNRSELVDRRTQKIKNIINLADKWANEENQELKDILKNEIDNEIAVDKEYLFITKGYLKTANINYIRAASPNTSFTQRARVAVLTGGLATPPNLTAAAAGSPEPNLRAKYGSDFALRLEGVVKPGTLDDILVSRVIWCMWGFR